MGTRADFYVGRGKDAEWIGSIAFDGHPEGAPEAAAKAKTEADFRAEVATLTGQDDGTRPDMGWPWPWEDSKTTDYAYCFDGGQVWAACYGDGWWKADEEHPEDDRSLPKQEFPDMSARKATAKAGTKRSGVIVLSLAARGK